MAEENRKRAQMEHSKIITSERSLIVNSKRMTTKQPRLFSYILRIDDGAAPNPFWGLCTLTICKPRIREKAKPGDWVVGTGSKRVRQKNGTFKDYSNHLIYAMKVTCTKSLKEYDTFCKTKFKKKIPKYYNRNDYRLRMGDCIYDYSNRTTPTLRPSVHKEKNIKTDLSGLNSLLSDHFYYFGNNPVIVPSYLKTIIKKNQGHKKIENQELIDKFINWISQYKKNKLYGQPQLKYRLEVLADKNICNICATKHLNDDLENLDEETIEVGCQ
jgi:hypothetical protein